MSALASDDGAEATQPPTGQGDGAQAPSPVRGQGEPPDASPWLEPQVQSLAIFTELFSAGERTEAEMAQMLTRYTTTMAWSEFWAHEGYITEVVRGSERRFTLSGKAALVLELP